MIADHRDICIAAHCTGSDGFKRDAIDDGGTADAVGGFDTPGAGGKFSVIVLIDLLTSNGVP
jgi:hypothetical protein